MKLKSAVSWFGILMGLLLAFPLKASDYYFNVINKDHQEYTIFMTEYYRSKETVWFGSQFKGWKDNNRSYSENIPSCTDKLDNEDQKGQKGFNPGFSKESGFGYNNSDCLIWIGIKIKNRSEFIWDSYCYKFPGFDIATYYHGLGRIDNPEDKERPVGVQEKCTFYIEHGIVSGMGPR